MPNTTIRSRPNLVEKFENLIEFMEMSFYKFKENYLSARHPVNGRKINRPRQFADPINASK